jgi:hypothetical protein
VLLPQPSRGVEVGSEEWEKQTGVDKSYLFLRELLAEFHFYANVARTMCKHECMWLVAVCYATKSV